MKDEQDHKKVGAEDTQDAGPEITTDTGDDVSLEQDSEFSEHTARQNKDVVADLRARLKKSDEEKREYLTGWQKLKADYINSRKQDEEDNKRRIKYAEEELLTELAPVLDSFEMAFANKEELAKLPEVWRKGVEQIHNQFFAILTNHKVKIIDPLGEPFDPRESEAVGIVEVTDPKQDDVVISVLQKGYKVHDKIIRPAKVRVGKLA